MLIIDLLVADNCVKANPGDKISNMTGRQKLYEFTKVLGHALKLIQIANQVPEFVLTKARDINAQQTLEVLKNYDDDFELLKEIASKKSGSRVSNDLGLETKKDLYNFIDKVKNAVENVKSPHYKLMIDRYNYANILAEHVQIILGNLLLAEQEVKVIEVEQDES